MTKNTLLSILYGLALLLGFTQKEQTPFDHHEITSTDPDGSGESPIGAGGNW